MFTLLWDDFTIYLGEIEHLPVICDPNNLVIVSHLQLYTASYLPGCANHMSDHHQMFTSKR